MYAKYIQSSIVRRVPCEEHAVREWDWKPSKGILQVT